jgi:hypothetical protein
VITIATLSSTVRAVPSEAEPAGTVRYRLTRAASGTVHVSATGSPHGGTGSTPSGPTLGAASARQWLAEPLVRIRGRNYRGNTLRVLAYCADVPWGGRTPCPWSTPTTTPRPSRPARP